MAFLSALLEIPANSGEIPGILTIVVPLACLALVLAWWAFIVRRRGGLD